MQRSKNQGKEDKESIDIMILAGHWEKRKAQSSYFLINFMIVIIMIITIIIMTIVDSLTAGEHWPKEQGSGLSASASAWWWWRWWWFFCVFLIFVQCTGSTLGCHLLWKRANPSVLILQHSSLAPICFFTGSIYSSPCQNKTLPLRPCSSLKYSLAWKEVYIKATVKGVKTNHKDVFLFLNGKYAGVIFHKNYQYHDSLFKIEYGAFDKCIIYKYHLFVVWYFWDQRST